MFGINDALRERELEEGPIRVAIIGAGTMGGSMAHQLVTAKGMNPDSCPLESGSKPHDFQLAGVSISD
jgi:predicted homoserine dehydrogenase-like protein